MLRVRCMLLSELSGWRCQPSILTCSCSDAGSYPQPGWGHPKGCGKESLQHPAKLAAPMKAAAGCTATSLSVLEMSFKSKQTKTDNLPKTRRVEQTSFSANKLRAELCLLCPWQIYLCICMHKPAQACMLTYIFSCFVDAVMHKDEHCTINQVWHRTCSCLGNTSLYHLVLVYPREGADNPLAEFDSHKAANKGLSLAPPLPIRYIWHMFFIKLGKSKWCEAGESKPVRKEIMSELLHMAWSLTISFFFLF